MGKKEKLRRTVDIPIGRVRLLADVIFASSMTIMILNFDMPTETEMSSESDLLTYFRDQREALLTYVVSFLLVFIYWMKHLEHFSYVRKTSSGHVWLQAFFLMALMLVPVVNTIYSTFPEHRGAATAYCITVLLVGLFSFLSWRFATQGHRLVDQDLEPDLIKDIGREALVEPSAALLAIISIWAISSDLVEPLFLLVPIAHTIRKKFRHRLLVRGSGTA